MDGVSSDNRRAGQSGSHIGSDDDLSSESGSNQLPRTNFHSTLTRQRETLHLELNANVDDTNVRRKQRVKIRKNTEASDLRGKFTSLINFFCPCRRQRKEAPKKKDDDLQEKTQFTVHTKSSVKEGILKRNLTKIAYVICIGNTSESFSALRRFFADHLHWLFRISLPTFIIYAAAWFYALILMFTGFITAAGNARPECVRVGGKLFGHESTQFSDAFSLSWHTFSTVGYGSVNPAKKEQQESIVVCELISIICVVEAFVGILYGAVIGSILFGRFARVQSRAQVVFSDPILVRYGSGVRAGGEDGDDEEEGHKLPCPVLEFRIANLLHDYPGGEILEASINVVASLDAEEADAEQREEVTAVSYMKAMFDRKAQRLPNGSNSNHGTETNDDNELGSSILGRRMATRKNPLRTSLKDFRMKSSMLRGLRFIDEDSNSSFAQRRVFTHLVLECPEHPFFKRVWIGRHVLDSQSPLLTSKVRSLIRKNNGHWPEELNSAEKVRASLCFSEILVSLNGILNVSATEVYEQKIYDYVDLAVGYHFVKLLYKNHDNNLMVDVDLINDVKEQMGGGGENLSNRP